MCALGGQVSYKQTLTASWFFSHQPPSLDARQEGGLILHCESPKKHELQSKFFLAPQVAPLRYLLTYALPGVLSEPMTPWSCFGVRSSTDLSEVSGMRVTPSPEYRMKDIRVLGLGREAEACEKPGCRWSTAARSQGGDLPTSPSCPVYSPSFQA